eukprot:jgi/Orpsp1_1/1182897/evm.model.c7180000083107.1
MKIVPVNTNGQKDVETNYYNTTETKIIELYDNNDEKSTEKNEKEKTINKNILEENNVNKTKTKIFDKNIIQTINTNTNIENYNIKDKDKNYYIQIIKKKNLECQILEIKLNEKTIKEQVINDFDST